MDSSLTANLEALGTSLTNGPPLELPAGINTYYENIVFSLNTTASVITIILVLWTVLNVVFDTVVKDAEMKENVRYINTKLFGTSGLLNNLFGLWVVFLAAIYAVYGLMFLNSNVVAANIRVNQVSEKSILENLPIIGKLVGLINSTESS